MSQDLSYVLTSAVRPKHAHAPNTLYMQDMAMITKQAKMTNLFIHTVTLMHIFYDEHVLIYEQHQWYNAINK